MDAGIPHVVPLANIPDTDKVPLLLIVPLVLIEVPHCVAISGK